MMKVSDKVGEKVFTGKTFKEAYLKACKWYASNVISCGKSDNVCCTFDKLKTKTYGVCQVRITVSVMIDETDTFNKMCDICKETGRLFYMAENKHICESCKIPPYRRRMIDRVSSLRQGKGITFED